MHLFLSISHRCPGWPAVACGALGSVSQGFVQLTCCCGNTWHHLSFESAACLPVQTAATSAEGKHTDTNIYSVYTCWEVNMDELLEDSDVSVSWVARRTDPLINSHAGASTACGQTVHARVFSQTCLCFLFYRMWACWQREKTEVQSPSSSVAWVTFLLWSTFGDNVTYSLLSPLSSITIILYSLLKNDHLSDPGFFLFVCFCHYQY